MVVLHVKSAAYASPPAEGEEMEFLCECAASAAVADVAAGLQARLLSLCRRLRGERGVRMTAAGELERALDEAEAYASKEKREIWMASLRIQSIFEFL